MKTLAMCATVAALMLPGVAAAACSWSEQQASQISCADGQVYDAATRACVPQTS